MGKVQLLWLFQERVLEKESITSKKDDHWWLNTLRRLLGTMTLLIEDLGLEKH